MTVENISGQGQGMAVAIVGLPAGLDAAGGHEAAEGARPAARRRHEARHDRHVRNAGRELVLYWRDLAPDQKIEVPRPDVPRAGRVPRPGEPGVTVLQRRRQALGRAAEGEHRGEDLRQVASFVKTLARAAASR